jgi:hypothetical protein
MHIKTSPHGGRVPACFGDKPYIEPTPIKTQAIHNNHNHEILDFGNKILTTM